MHADAASPRLAWADRTDVTDSDLPPLPPRQPPRRASMFDALPDDALQLVLEACGGTFGIEDADVPLLKDVKGLACLSKALLQQLHRLQPLVGVRSLAAVQHPAHDPWRVMLKYKGELTEAVVEQARQGRVRSIDAQSTTLAPSVARRVFPAVLGRSLFDLNLYLVGLNGTWAETFGEAAVSSAVLVNLNLQRCNLQGPLPELRLPSLLVLELSENQFSGGLEPLRECKSLTLLFMAYNQLEGSLKPLEDLPSLICIDLSNNHDLTGELEPLKNCTTLQQLQMPNNELTGELEPLKSCTELQKLWLPFNGLPGGLEPLRGCTALEDLSLSDNLLTGGLGPLQGCTALLHLRLSENQLTGGLEPLQDCTALQTLRLEDNHLTGGLEPLRACTSLDRLFLSSNQFTG